MNRSAATGLESSLSFPPVSHLVGRPPQICPRPPPRLTTQALVQCRRPSSDAFPLPVGSLCPHAQLPYRCQTDPWTYDTGGATVCSRVFQLIGLAVGLRPCSTSYLSPSARVVAVSVWFVVPQASVSLMSRKPKPPDENYTFQQLCLVLTCWDSKTQANVINFSFAFHSQGINLQANNIRFPLI